MNERLVFFVAVLSVVSLLLLHRIYDRTCRGDSIVVAVSGIKDTELFEILWDASLFVGLVSSVPVLLDSSAPMQSLLAVTALVIIQARRLVESHVLHSAQN